MASANPSLELIDGRRIYTLRQHRKPWYKDGEARQVEVQRFGFPIVPDFGGTARSYCGSSLDACIGDLLDWWQKPQRDGAVRGYIIKSRIRETQNLLLAKPYSPHLFRLRPPAGPNYLLKVLQGTMSKKAALAEWDADDKLEAVGQEDGTQEPAVKLHKWPFTMPLPCRDCSTEKELSAFIGTTTFAYDAIWGNYISKGQDLVCTKCRQARGATNGTITIYCECCKTQKRRKEFEPEMAQRWENIQEDTYIVCKSCTRGGRQMGRKPTEKGVKYKCCGVGCSSETQQKELIGNNFLEEHLTHAQENQRHAKCARCLVLDDNTISMKVKCNGCGVSKHLKEYSAIQCKEFLNGDRTFHKWQCYECWYPECSVPGCTERPLVAVAHNHVEADGSWYCHSHQYPPCSVALHLAQPAPSVGKSNSRHGFVRHARSRQTMALCLELLQHSLCRGQTKKMEYACNPLELCKLSLLQ